MDALRVYLSDRVRSLISWWAEQRAVLRWGIVAVGCVAVLVLAALLAAVANGPEAEAGIVLVPATRTSATPVPPAPATPTPGDPEVTSTPEASPTPDIVKTLRDLVERVGYPAEVSYARLRIPVIGLDAPVGARTVQRGEPMPEPIGPAHLLCYDLGRFPGMGGAPGSGGNAIFAGHVDWNDRIPYAPEVRFRGPAAFFDLRRLSRGDIIEVDYDGETLRYRVVWRDEFSAVPGATDWGADWRGTPGVDELTLYTCGGDFDAATRSYADRVVVRAERM